MSLSNQQNQGGPIGNPGLPKTQKTTKRVADIILNKDHAAYTGPDSIGIIFFTDEKTKEFTNDTTSLPRAKPSNLNNFTTPLIGELVNVIQSTSDDYYPDLGGNSNFTSNYYTAAINIHNNAGSNAIPLDTKAKEENKTRQSSPNFEFQKEFRTSGSQNVAVKMLSNYLRTLGLDGRSDPRSPIYTLFRDPGGDYILRLDDSKDNKAKLGTYYRENPNQKNLNLTEGGTVNQGKSGQRISFSANDKANVSDLLEQNRAMVLSLGDGEAEDINDDDGTIHLATNRKVNIKTSSNLIASLHSEYKPYVEPLKEIEKEPVVVTPTTNPTPTLQVENHFAGIGTSVKEVTSTTVAEVDIEDPFITDPVFAALDEAIEEGILSEQTPEEYEFDQPSVIYITEESQPELPTQPSNPSDPLNIPEGADPAPIINPNKFGQNSPGISKSGTSFDKSYYCPSFKKFKFTLRDNSVTKEDVMKYVDSGDLVMVADANLYPLKFSPYMGSAIRLDKRYYLHKSCAQSFINWEKEMEEKGIYYLLTSALRYSSKTGGGPHGLGLAVDFGNLFGELENYGKRGSTSPAVNKKGRIGSQTYKDIATIGAKWGWYNPWRLSDVGGSMDELWHFEYWGESLA
jgi:hypothetical protein